uniref:Src kinase-associated phosphoprotein 2 n=1 Tax=Oryzias sinensis TaxID=183150 RepID=A0A8C7WZ88_9TELE
MRTIPEELAALISDLEHFLCKGLKGELLSRKTKEKREAFIKRIKEVKQGFPQDFKDKGSADTDEDEEADSNNDGGSLQSERTDKEEEPYDGVQQSPPVAVQDLKSVFKQGCLEKRRKDHSFFGPEWQKRWCALSQNIFYYYGSEKDKQQKGEFNIEGYSVQLNNTLRKDSKKDCCFEISAPDKRVYQFCASSVQEAKEWVKKINFVLRSMTGEIPEEEEEDEEESNEYYDDVGVGAIDEDLYEELPGLFLWNRNSLCCFSPPIVDKSTNYQNYYQGLWDCDGDQADELSFKRGETIYILSKEYSNFGWWVGEKNGAIGIVPKDYLLELYVL